MGVDAAIARSMTKPSAILRIVAESTCRVSQSLAFLARRGIIRHQSGFPVHASGAKKRTEWFAF